MEGILDPELKRSLERLLQDRLTEPAQERLVLRLRLDDAQVPLRGLASYLAFIDRAYGRLYPGGLASYAQRRREHVRLAQVRAGSLEAVLEQLLTNLDGATYLLVLYLLLKHLPALVQALAEAYHDVQAGRLARAQEEEIRARLRSELTAAGLTEEDRTRLARLLLELAEKEQRHLPSAAAFGEAHVREIELEAS